MDLYVPIPLLSALGENRFLKTSVKRVCIRWNSSIRPHLLFPLLLGVLGGQADSSWEAAGAATSPRPGPDWGQRESMTFGKMT